MRKRGRVRGKPTLSDMPDNVEKLPAPVRGLLWNVRIKQTKSKST